MDSNNTPHFLLREENEFRNRSRRFCWNSQRGALVLAQNQTLRLPSSNPTNTVVAWENSQPLVQDSFGQLGRISTNSQQIEFNAGRGFKHLRDGELASVTAPVGEYIDLTIGGTGRLAALYSNNSDQHGVLVFDLAQRWQRTVALPNKPIRACIDRDNRTWIICEEHLILVDGKPLPHPYQAQASRFEPVSINPTPLRIVCQQAWQAPATTEQAMAITCDESALFILTHNHQGTQRIHRRRLIPQKEASIHRFTIANDVPFASDLGVYNKDRLALLVPQDAADSDFLQRDCPLLSLQWDDESNSAELVRTAELILERFPRLSEGGVRFVSTMDKRLHYPATYISADGGTDSDIPAHPRPLLPLKRPRYFSAAHATLLEELDSEQADTIWHRLYLDAHIPSGTRIRIFVKAYNSSTERSQTKFVEQPLPTWNPLLSEKAHGRNLAQDCRKRFDPQAQMGHATGLFDTLLQHQSGSVRQISGRYLQIRLLMEGTGLQTPALHALRIYYPRFSYQEHYLPAHMRQDLMRPSTHNGTNNGADNSADNSADNAGPANGADVRERLLANFEGMLTPIEGQVIAAEGYLHPRITNRNNLYWLTELMGESLPEHWPEKRQRRFVSCIGTLQKWRGTLQGVRLALDIVTDGAVADGQVVLVENFRLRRTMATVLGVNMDDEDHPLTLGTGMSGNSLVGDSLILSDAHAREFLALFSPQISSKTDTKEGHLSSVSGKKHSKKYVFQNESESKKESDKEIVERFFDHYAHQVTILLHGPARQQCQAVETVLKAEMPAHVQWQLFETETPFVLGLSPLLCVDSWIESKPPAHRVTLDDTALGREGILKNPVALSPQDALSHL